MSEGKDKFTVIKGGQVKGEFDNFEEARDFAYSLLENMREEKVKIRDSLEWQEKNLKLLV